MGNAGAAAAFCQEIFGDVTTLFSEWEGSEHPTVTATEIVVKGN